MVLKTVCLIKLRKTGLPENMFNISQSNHPCETQLPEDATIFYCRKDVFKYYLLKVLRPTAEPTYNIYNPIGFKFFTTLKFCLSHLK